MTTPTNGARRGPGRPPRPDGLKGEAAREARGLARLNLRLPATSLALLDEIASHLGTTRGGAIVALIGQGVAMGWTAARTK